jgi:hypothetical protein
VTRGPRNVFCQAALGALQHRSSLIEDAQSEPTEAAPRILRASNLLLSKQRPCENDAESQENSEQVEASRLVVFASQFVLTPRLRDCLFFKLAPAPSLNPDSEV